jgi:5'-3' exonuclease
MSSPWLILDSNFLCHRAYHVLGELKYGNQGTGIIFGFLRDILSLQDLFLTNKFVFCFDLGVPYRVIDYPAYKETRRKERKKRVVLNDQIKLLRKEILPSLGFKNVLYQKGYEADDLIASVCGGFGKKDSGIIISADKDLFQLLSAQVTMYNPQSKKMVSAESFTKQWGCDPTCWPNVKAIAGCSTDEIAGIEGVKEKTAVKFITGTMNPQSATFDRIVKGHQVWQENLRLVTLPYPATKTFELKPGIPSVEQWKAVCRQYGINSLPNMPVSRKAIKRKGFGLNG